MNKNPAVMLFRQARNVWFGVKEFFFLKTHADRSARFSRIYHGNLWKNAESRSGYGSTLAATKHIRQYLERLIQDGDISSILDLPCGDFNWMRHVNFDGHYIGADIVEDLIAENQRAYGSKKREFRKLDFVKDAPPKAELVLCRECLNHLSLAECQAGLENLLGAVTKILVVTHYPEITQNEDQETSFRFRPLNLTIAPFALRQPDKLIEDFESGERRYLAVWDCQVAPVKRGNMG